MRSMASSLKFAVLLVLFATSISAAPSTLPVDVAALSRRMKMKVYGNWCGPKHGSGCSKNALDLAYKYYYYCYSRHGYFNCKCDVDLVRRIRRLKSRRLRVIAIPIKAFLKHSAFKGLVKRLSLCGFRPCRRCKRTWLVSWAKKYVKEYSWVWYLLFLLCMFG